MLHKDTKISEHFSQRESQPENTDEYLAELRISPRDLPSTHVHEYWWEDRATKENPRLLPVMYSRVRELNLDEIAKQSDDFAKLPLSELRQLVDTHKVKMLAMPNGKDGKPIKQDDDDAIRDALRAHLKSAPKDSLSPRASVPVRSNTHKPAKVIALPEDIAKMNQADIETQAATIGKSEEYRSVKDKNVHLQRQWLASMRQAEPVTV